MNFINETSTLLKVVSTVIATVVVGTLMIGVTGCSNQPAVQDDPTPIVDATIEDGTSIKDMDKDIKIAISDSASEEQINEFIDYLINLDDIESVEVIPSDRAYQMIVDNPIYDADLADMVVVEEDNCPRLVVATLNQDIEQPDIVNLILIIKDSPVFNDVFTYVGNSTSPIIVNIDTPSESNTSESLGSSIKDEIAELNEIADSEE